MTSSVKSCRFVLARCCKPSGYSTACFEGNLCPWFSYRMTERHGGYMAQHVKIIGILHIVFGSLLILAGLICLVVMGGIAGMVGTTSHSSDDLAAVPLLGGIGGLIFV